MKKIIMFISLIVFQSSMAQIGTNFTYQGELLLNNQAVTGMYDLKFVLFDAELDTEGNIVGQSVSINVDVAQGIFTTQIDFGVNAFSGDEVWMEINIRDGGTTGGYQQMLPRVAITSAPYAIHAQFVGADAVTGDEVLDGSIMNIDMGDNSVDASNIVNNTIGTTEINTAQVQRRVSGNCITGSVIQSINENGSVNCLPVGPELTPFAGSAIMTSSQQQQVNKLVGNTKQLWTRCYQLSVDTKTSSEFHSKCDSLGPSVTFFSMPDSPIGVAKVFGGYTENSWVGNFNGYRGYDPAFLFSLDTGTDVIEKFPIGNNYQASSYNHPSYGPTFGSGHDVYINSNMQLGYVNFPYAFSCDQRPANSPSVVCTQRLSGLSQLVASPNTDFTELEVWVMQN